MWYHLAWIPHRGKNPKKVNKLAHFSSIDSCSLAPYFFESGSWRNFGINTLPLMARSTNQHCFQKNSYSLTLESSLNDSDNTYQKRLFSLKVSQITLKLLTKNYDFEANLKLIFFDKFFEFQALSLLTNRIRNRFTGRIKLEH